MVRQRTTLFINVCDVFGRTWTCWPVRSVPVTTCSRRGGASARRIGRQARAADDRRAYTVLGFSRRRARMTFPEPGHRVQCDGARSVPCARVAAGRAPHRPPRGQRARGECCASPTPSYALHPAPCAVTRHLMPHGTQLRGRGLSAPAASNWLPLPPDRRTAASPARTVRARDDAAEERENGKFAPLSRRPWRSVMCAAFRPPHSAAGALFFKRTAYTGCRRSIFTHCNIISAKNKIKIF